MIALVTAVRQNQPLPPPKTEPAPAPVRVVDSPTRNDFVGRAAELKNLQEAWEGVQQQGSAAILIEGVAGAGKTRLVQEFLHTLPPEHHAFRGNCYESTRAIPYQPWLTILEKWLQALPAVERDHLAQPWQAQLSRLLPQVFPASSDVPEQQEHLFRAVAELLRLGSKPHILLLEDLQWADEASLQLFLFMAHFIQPQSSQSPILLLGTLRSEEAADNPALQTLLHDAQREALAQRLTLPPLGKEEISSLIGVLWLNAPAETPIDEIRDNLLAAAGGNPLFVTEILRELTQTAVLPTPLPIPPSLQELTNRRLRQLPGSSRQVIETLAVFEQPTHFDLIQQVSGRTEDETVTAIELGLRWRFLEPRQASQYGFSHDLIGDAVRRQLSQIRRQRLHHRVADALTQRGADAAILAHHWGMAGSQEQQARFALQAGEKALRRAAFGDAIYLFQNGLDALPSTDIERRFQATLGIVQALEAVSNVPELSKKIVVLANLADQTREPVWRAESAQHQAKFALLQGELDKVETIVRQGLEWAAAAQAASLEASLWETLGKTYRDQGNYDQAYAHAQHALELYQTDNNSQGQIAVLNLLGNLNVHRGQHRQAVQVHQQALALCRQITDPFSESRILAWLADALWYLGDYEEVQKAVAEGLAVSREIGDKVGEMVQSNNLAGLAVVEQDIEQAIVYYRQALAIAESMNDPRRTAVYYGNIGGAYVGLGDIPAALGYLDKAIAIAQKAKLPRQEAHAHYTKGRAYQEEGDLVAARAAFEHSLSLRQGLGEQFRTFLTLIQLVEICVQLADWPSAETHLAAAQRLYDTLHDEFARYSHQMFHYVAFLFYKEQANPSAAALHLEQAHLALQDCLAELDGPAREQLRTTPQAQAILAAIANNKL
jgi:predicted ATPase